MSGEQEGNGWEAQGEDEITGMATGMDGGKRDVREGWCNDGKRHGAKRIAKKAYHE